MAVKIFCNACQRFIRDARNKNEINDLTGHEICQDCEQSVSQVLVEIERTAKRAVTAIQGLLSTCKAEIEENMRRVVKNE